MELMNIIYSIITLIIGSLIIKLLSKQLIKMTKSKVFNELIKHSGYSEAILWFISYFIKAGMYFILALIAISFLGFAPQVLGLLAVILAFSIISVLTYSLRDLIPSAFAGAYLKHSKVIKKDDKIMIKGFKGTVKEVGMLATVIKDWKGSTLIMPNKLIMERVIRKR